MRCLFVRRQMLLAVDGGWILRKRVAHEKRGIENFNGNKQVNLVRPICKQSAKHCENISTRVCTCVLVQIPTFPKSMVQMNLK